MLCVTATQVAAFWLKFDKLSHSLFAFLREQKNVCVFMKNNIIAAEMKAHLHNNNCVLCRHNTEQVLEVARERERKNKLTANHPSNTVTECSYFGRPNQQLRFFLILLCSFIFPVLSKRADLCCDGRLSHFEHILTVNYNCFFFILSPRLCCI